MRLMSFVVLTVLFAGSAIAADAEPAFKVLEVEQSGGFAGLRITYRVTPDGKFARKSRQGKLESKLDAADTAALAKAVAAINWETLPRRLRDPNVADDFQYDMHFVIGKQTYRVTTDGISAEKNAQLKPIIKLLRKMQREPINQKK